MTYIIEGFRSEGRVRIGRVGMRSVNARVLAGLGAVSSVVVPSIPGGSGSSNDPFGGVGGGTEAQLKSLVAAGLTFSSPKAETGLLNGEKYVYCKGSNSKFYKFKVPGSGLGKTPSDASALQWFNTTIAAAKPPVKKVPSTPTTSINLPQVTVPSGVVTGGKTLPPGFTQGTLLREGEGGTDDGKSSISPTMIAGALALLAVGVILLKKRGKAAA